MGRWYFRSIEGTGPGKTRGPYSESELKALAESGSIPATVKIFNVGREHDAVSLKSVIGRFSLAERPHSITASPGASVILESGTSESTTVENTEEGAIREVPSGDKPRTSPPPSSRTSFWGTVWRLHPKRRYLARMVDVSVGSFVVSRLYSLGGYQTEDISKITGVLFFGVFVAAVINALSISKFGTTIGKWMFGIRVLNEDRSQLSTGRAFTREGLVFLFGFSGGVAFAVFLSLIITGMFIHLKQNTPWDFLTLTTTEINRVSLSRILIGTILLLLAGTLIRLI